MEVNQIQKEHNNPPDPYEVGIQEDPYNEEVLSSYDSDDSYLTKQEKLFNKVAKPVKRRKGDYKKKQQIIIKFVNKIQNFFTLTKKQKKKSNVY